MVVQPKFTWSPILQPNLEEDRKIILSGSQPQSVELLSIIRVNKPTLATPASSTGGGWDRSLYPFCRLDRTLCVTTNDLTHPFLVFEARTPSERDWLVVALKLIVARLASIIIVRDEEMLLEFFSPFSAIMSEPNDEEYDEEVQRTDDRPCIHTFVPRSSPPTSIRKKTVHPLRDEERDIDSVDDDGLFTDDEGGILTDDDDADDDYDDDDDGDNDDGGHQYDDGKRTAPPLML
jgi:hypothetical protein